MLGWRTASQRMPIGGFRRSHIKYSQLTAEAVCLVGCPRQMLCPFLENVAVLRRNHCAPWLGLLDGYNARLWITNVASSLTAVRNSSPVYLFRWDVALNEEEQEEREKENVQSFTFEVSFRNEWSFISGMLLECTIAHFRRACSTWIAACLRTPTYWECETVYHSNHCIDEITCDVELGMSLPRSGKRFSSSKKGCR